MIKLDLSDALIVVDVQNDFCPLEGSALPVPEGDKVVGPLNNLIELVSLVVFTRDWHPEKSVHFKNWPVHCVGGTRGAEFHPGLRYSSAKEAIFVLKGMDPNNDGGYSGFAKVQGTESALEDLLKKTGVKRVFVGGLATDYCVKATVLDALKNGFKVVVVLDAVRAVNLNSDDGERAIEEMKNAGAEFALSSEISSP